MNFSPIFYLKDSLQNLHTIVGEVWIDCSHGSVLVMILNRERVLLHLVLWAASPKGETELLKIWNAMEVHKSTSHYENMKELMGVELQQGGGREQIHRERERQSKIRKWSIFSEQAPNNNSSLTSS